MKLRGEPPCYDARSTSMASNSTPQAITPDVRLSQYLLLLGIFFMRRPNPSALRAAQA